jgi:hypothetical protein
MNTQAWARRLAGTTGVALAVAAASVVLNAAPAYATAHTYVRINHGDDSRVNLAIHVPSAVIGAQAVVQPFDPNNADKGEWEKIDVPSIAGAFQFKNHYSGLCLRGQYVLYGTRVVQDVCATDLRQYWLLTMDRIIWTMRNVANNWLLAAPSTGTGVVTANSVPGDPNRWWQMW